MLTELQRTLSNNAAFVQPHIEISRREIIKKTEVVIKPVPRLERPAKGSLIGAMFKPRSASCACCCSTRRTFTPATKSPSSGLIRPPWSVASRRWAPVIGPVVFLCSPTNLPASEEELADENATPLPPPGALRHHTACRDPGAAAPGQTNADGSAAAPGLPQTQVFKRGQFTFNRRFIGPFSAFFGAIRRGNDGDLVLIVKSVRGEHRHAHLAHCCQRHAPRRPQGRARPTKCRPRSPRFRKFRSNTKTRKLPPGDRARVMKKYQTICSLRARSGSTCGKKSSATSRISFTVRGDVFRSLSVQSSPGFLSITPVAASSCPTNRP